MSLAIPVHVGDQLVEVQPMRLDWASKHPELVELLDWYRQTSLLGQADMTTPQELAKLQQLVEEICKASGFEGELDCDVGDVGLLYAAVRGIAPPDPTRPPSG